MKIYLSDLLYLTRLSQEKDYPRLIVGFIAWRKQRKAIFSPFNYKKDVEEIRKVGHRILSSLEAQERYAKEVQDFIAQLVTLAEALKDTQGDPYPTLEQGEAKVIAELQRIKGGYEQAMQTPLEELWYYIKAGSKDSMGSERGYKGVKEIKIEPPPSGKGVKYGFKPGAGWIPIKEGGDGKDTA